MLVLPMRKKKYRREAVPSVTKKGGFTSKNK